MLNSELLNLELLNSELLNGKLPHSDISKANRYPPLASESHAALHGPILTSKRLLQLAPRPAIVWPSSPQSVTAGVSDVRAARRSNSSLRLVPPSPAPRRTLSRHPKPATTRTRLVESAYLAAALLSAAVLWWTAR